MKHCITEALESRRLFAVAGSFDTSFSFDGRQTFNISGRNDFADDILVQPDGKVVVAGTTSNPNSPTPDSDYWIARYTTAGVLDTSFSGDGVQVIQSATQGDLGAIALTSDGKIVIVGQYAVNTTEPRAFVARLHSNGTLDNGFAGDGFYVLPATPEVYRFSDVTVQADNKVVAVGEGESGIAIARYNVNGTPDINFGAGGLRLMAVGSRLNFAGAVQMQTDGKIVVAGTANDYGMYENMFVARLKANGQNDTSFNGYGINILDNEESDRGTSLALSGNRNYVGGEGYSSKATIWKVDADGQLNHAFGANGHWSGGSGTVADLAVQNTGKIV
jgi:uncharacterized delta-60 repeat protein